MPIYRSAGRWFISPRFSLARDVILAIARAHAAEEAERKAR